jgi:hypothetical protein
MFVFCESAIAASARDLNPAKLTRISLARRAMLCFFLALIVPLTGCVSGGGYLDGHISNYRNHVWGNRAYNLRYGNCDRDYPEHFKRGFIDGYTDVCNGGDGYVPAVPPEDYWSHQYQSQEGANCVNTWFKSYPLGAKAAREDGAGAFQKVYISKMVRSAIVQDRADHVLPDDVPVVTPEKEVAKKLPAGPSPTIDQDFEADEFFQRTAGAHPNAKSKQ